VLYLLVAAATALAIRCHPEARHAGKRVQCSPPKSARNIGPPPREEPLGWTLASLPPEAHSEQRATGAERAPSFFPESLGLDPRRVPAPEKLKEARCIQAPKGSLLLTLRSARNVRGRGEVGLPYRSSMASYSNSRFAQGRGDFGADPSVFRTRPDLLLWTRGASQKGNSCRFLATLPPGRRPSPCAMQQAQGLVQGTLDAAALFQVRPRIPRWTNTRSNAPLRPGQHLRIINEFPSPSPGVDGRRTGGRPRGEGEHGDPAANRNRLILRSSVGPRGEQAHRIPAEQRRLENRWVFGFDERGRDAGLFRRPPPQNQFGIRSELFELEP